MINTALVKLIQRAREAIDRGDMYVGHISEFPGDLEMFSRMMEISVGVYGDKVLLKLRKPRLGHSRTGEIVRIVSMYDGVYYSMKGQTYREKDISWVRPEGKELPSG